LTGTELPRGPGTSEECSKGSVAATWGENVIEIAGGEYALDIAGAGHAPGYVIFSSSPADGSYLEWDASGKGKLDGHTNIEGYSVGRTG